MPAAAHGTRHAGFLQLALGTSSHTLCINNQNRCVGVLLFAGTLAGRLRSSIKVLITFQHQHPELKAFEVIYLYVFCVLYCIETATLCILYMLLLFNCRVLGASEAELKLCQRAKFVIRASRFSMNLWCVRVTSLCSRIKLSRRSHTQINIDYYRIVVVVGSLLTALSIALIIRLLAACFSFDCFAHTHTLCWQGPSIRISGGKK